MSHDHSDPTPPASSPHSPAVRGVSRRGVLGLGALGVAGALLPAPGPRSVAAAPEEDDDRGRKGGLLFRDGTVITPGSPPMPHTDILVVDGKIREIGPDIRAHGVGLVDCRGKFVTPGFIDTHRHMWQGLLRNIGPNDLLNDYLLSILGSDGTGFALSLTPEEVYLGDLVTALSALNAGITTILDWSHVNKTPEHPDAVIQALRESGIRAVYAYGPNFYHQPFWFPPETVNPYPEDLVRLAAQYFSSPDQLLTLALAAAGPQFAGGAAPAVYEWQTARSVGARISVHVGVGAGGGGAVAALRAALQAVGSDLGADTTYIHACTLTDEEFQMIADTGGSASLAFPIEMQMGHGTPPIQQCLKFGVPVSLSVDVETNQPTDMFTQMHGCFALQRELENRGHLFPDESHEDKLLTVQDVLALATIGGANANGLGAKVGSLEVGKEADILLLEARAINVAPVNDPVGAIVLGMDSSNVDSVYVAGRAIKRQGRLRGVNIDRLLARAEAARDAVRARVGV